MNVTDFEYYFNYSERVVYFPIRHHSPACSFHLKKAADAYKPECILIEGPEDGNFLMEYLGSSEIKPPFCIYSSYDDKDGKITEAKEKYRAYYPFLNYSPELTAIRWAAENSIPSYFIDMPYGMQLVNFGTESREKKFGDDNSQIYYKLAAERSGCRSFAELWENSFEIKGIEISSEDFVKSVFTLGKNMRELSGINQKDRYRECYMNENIHKYQKKYKRILVVTGAFHTAGFADKNESIKFEKYQKASSALYLMPYSFAETDSRSGYSAGIPFPAFYSSVWEKLSSGVKAPYEETVKEFIVKTARHARKKQPVSLPDETQALYMAKELAALRGRNQPGAFELTDGVKSAFVKGDITTAASLELDFLFRQMTGLGAGKINISDESKKIIPPCVADFRAQCKKFRINIGTISVQNTILDIVKNPKHYEKSCFLHRLDVIGTGFCRMEKGPDYENEKDTSLVREHWWIRYSTSVESRLTDMSVFGGNIGAVCLHILHEEFSNVHNASGAGRLLLKTYATGFSQKVTEYLPEITEIVHDDNDFISQCGFMASLSRLITLQKLLFSETGEGILSLLKISFFIALSRIETMCSADPDSEPQICECIRLMNSLSFDYPEQCPKNEFLDEIEKIAHYAETSPQIYSVCLSICAKTGRISQENYCESILSYMATADGDSAAGFISGIISVGRDIIFTNERVLMSIDSAFAAMEREQFLSVLPQLRRAFTSFLPSETSRISKMIANHYNDDVNLLFGSMTFTDEEILYAGTIDRKINEIMEKWGI